MIKKIFAGIRHEDNHRELFARNGAEDFLRGIKKNIEKNTYFLIYLMDFFAGLRTGNVRSRLCLDTPGSSRSILVEKLHRMSSGTFGYGRR